MDHLKEVRVPDLGGSRDVPVIELLVKLGDRVKVDQGIITLESDKATMEVPTSVAGIVRAWKARLGDTLSEGDLIALVEVAEPAADGTAATVEATHSAKADKAEAATAIAATVVTPEPAARVRTEPSLPTVASDALPAAPGNLPYASPVVRQRARELGVPLAQVAGSGRNGRILRGDVDAYVRNVLSASGERIEAAAPPASGRGMNLPPWPRVDFAQFGAVERQPLSRIQQLSGANLARNWAVIPHVTQHDQADITELEAFRTQLNREQPPGDAKITLLAFLIMASAVLLKRFPPFNASLDEDGETLILKRYCHIGFATDTPRGLLVPVLRHADQKGLREIAREAASLAAGARDGRLQPVDMQGGCFSISSLGGIGGTAFTPIVHAPEVAILGVSRSSIQPVWDGSAFQPRLLLPLSLSYDHRVVDGAAAARFTAELARLLGDFRRVLL